MISSKNCKIISQLEFYIKKNQVLGLFWQFLVKSIMQFKTKKMLLSRHSQTEKNIYKKHSKRFEIDQIVKSYWNQK